MMVLSCRYYIIICCYILLQRIVLSLNLSSIAFIYHNETRMQGSSIHRGYEMSHLMNASYIKCLAAGDGNSSRSEGILSSNQIYDIYIHVKIPCESILTTHLDSIHILDTLDKQYFEYYINIYDWHGVIFNTDLYKQKFCHKSNHVKLKNHRQQITSMTCMVIPHHYNLQCKVHSEEDAMLQQKDNGTSVAKSRINVGVIGSKQNRNHLFNPQVVRDFRSRSINLLFEDYSANSTMADICSFYDRINIALTWTSQDDLLIHTSADLSSKYSIYDFKSQERFTNPIMMNIPTIGYNKYQSFRHYNGSQEFLCPDLGCVQNLISRILFDGMKPMFKQLRQSVMQEVRVESVVAQYTELIAAVVANHKPYLSQ